MRALTQYCIVVPQHARNSCNEFLRLQKLARSLHPIRHDLLPAFNSHLCRNASKHQPRMLSSLHPTTRNGATLDNEVGHDAASCLALSISWGADQHQRGQHRDTRQRRVPATWGFRVLFVLGLEHAKYRQGQSLSHECHRIQRSTL